MRGLLAEWNCDTNGDKWKTLFVPLALQKTKAKSSNKPQERLKERFSWCASILRSVCGELIQ